MARLARRLGVAFAVLVLWATAPASAQENLDRGKTPAELYASDCAICHKSPRGLSRGGGLFGLSNFLREHYTASREAAAAIAAYLQQIDNQPVRRHIRRPRRKAKASEPKLPHAKPTAAKPSESKPTGTKPPETKASEAKPPAAEHEEAKFAEPKDGAKGKIPKADTATPAKDAKDATPDKKSD